MRRQADHAPDAGDRVVAAAAGLETPHAAAESTAAAAAAARAAAARCIAESAGAARPGRRARRALGERAQHV